ncbi:MAG TPA: ComEC/Rec2 family competence protein [Solirubrobacterales bacterium]|nr:ComEC/Rec2 family competence protein [Solirubrobacterales bacterium]
MRDQRLSPPLLLAVALAALLSLAHAGELRDRAETALGRGMPPREGQLARGFVLGEDEEIDPQTAEDFRRAGLSHLLAVSGQNVALLALLAMPLLAALGIPLRARLVWVLGLIAVYVPLAGAGPSIVRAGLMGALSVFATLAGRRASRLYALGFAATAMLVLDPGVAADVGWQLSFAAVLGILLLAPPLREAIVARVGGAAGRRALAEAGALTVAATLATAPLIAFHFGELSTTTFLANLLVLPAVAPAMWLGMLVAAAGQLPGFPVRALNAIEAPLLAYVAQIAAWVGRPSWAVLRVQIGVGGLVASYLLIAAGTLGALRLGRERRIAALRKHRAGAAGVHGYPQARRRFRRRRALLLLAAGTVAIGFVLAPLGGGGDAVSASPGGLRISVLDVGQGDAILLQPAAAPAILVDGGPPGDHLTAELRAADVERLGAVIVTHDQSDHAGGIGELIGNLPIERLLFGVLDRGMLADARAAGALTRRLARGNELRSGPLRLDVLWPPRELLAGPRAGDDPNRLAMVLLVRWRRFRMLLTADAEAEATPLDPGPLDVLKVAHHGSDDAGLAALLDRTRPRLAVISVGAGNPFGHPTAGTLATLAAHGVPILRTDRGGTVVLDVQGRTVRVSRG